MGDIEVFAVPEYIVLQKGNESLWCNRNTGTLSPRLGYEIKKEPNVVKVDTTCKCFVGKLRLLSESDWRLLLVTRASIAGRLPPNGDAVYCVDRISLLSLSPTLLPEEIKAQELKLQEGNEPVERPPSNPKEANFNEKLERRLIDAISRMFNDSKSFYFSHTGDLTRSLQQQVETEEEDKDPAVLPLWKKVDERFFWNYRMLEELTAVEYKGAVSDPWIVPVMQGYFEMMTLSLDSMVDSFFYVKKSTIHDTMSDLLPPIPEPLDTAKDTPPPEQLVQPPEQPVQPPEQPVQPSEQPVQPSEQPVQPPEQPVQPPEQPVQPPEQPVQPPEQPVQPPEQPVQPPEQPVQTPEQPVQPSEQPVQPPEQPVQPPEQPVQPPAQPVQPPAQPVQPPAQPDSDLEVRDSVHEEDEVVKDAKASNDSPSDEQAPQRRHSFATQQQGDGDMLRSLQPSTSTDNFELYEKPENVEDMPDGSLINLFHGKKDRKEPEMIPMQDLADLPDNQCAITIISRRSRHRAGTRYRRRGINPSGSVANFVETEQIVEVRGQVASFLIVRGSVPIYWSQPGYKYRPPPVIERGHFETSVAFRRHFEDLFNDYKEIGIVDLNNQRGKEQILGHAYREHSLELNNPKLTYVAFDYHRYCKGGQLENAKLLTDRLQDITKKFRFTWTNRTDTRLDMLCCQQGVYRVNCLDCLDRTNVIQSQICKEMLLSVLHKLMVYDPEQQKMSGEALSQFQQLWANNGDVISRQYTGTDAIKGDLTRYGERNIKSYVKDGYNSAHRYLRNLFADTYTQIVIDLQQGVSITEAHRPIKSEEMDGLEWREGEFTWTEAKEKETSDAINICKSTLYPNMEPTHILGWGLLEPSGCSFLDGITVEQVVYLLFNKEQETICVSNYNMLTKEVCSYIRLDLKCLKKIEVGPLGTRRHSSKRSHIRIHYTLGTHHPTCYFTFLPLHYSGTTEDKAILDSIGVALMIQLPTLEVVSNRLPKKRSPQHPGIVFLKMPKHLEENYESDMSSSSEDDDRRTPDILVEDYKEEVLITLTTPKKTEYNLLIRTLNAEFPSKSAPTSPTLERRHNTLEPQDDSSDNEDESIAVLRQRSVSVELLPSLEKGPGFDDEKQSEPSDKAAAKKERTTTFSKFTTGIVSKLKAKNRFFSDPPDSAPPPLPEKLEQNTKASPKEFLRKNFATIKERTKKKFKRDSKTNVLFI